MQALSSPTPSFLKTFRHRLSRKSLEQTVQLFGPAVHPEPFQSPPHPSGAKWRERVFTPWLIFWGFLSQVLGKSSCRCALQQIQGLCAVSKQDIPASDTSAYCQARARLPLASLKTTFANTGMELENLVQPDHRWLNRRVRVVDCTSASMPDTGQNQQVYPQPAEQKPGCGFPVVKIAALFSLATGAMLAFVLSQLRIHDSLLFLRLWEWLQPGDVVLGDRAFCSYAAIFQLQQKKVDVVFRLHQRRPIDFRKGKRLGKNDHLIHWKKPPQRLSTMTPEEFAALPPNLQLRQVRFSILIPGFRTTVITLVTTLLDPQAYPPSALADLFRLRWRIELSFRDLKTTMGMEVLSCLSPTMIEKEISMFFIAYNLIRWLMWQTAVTHRLHISELSFKGSLDLVQSWAWIFWQTQPNSRKSKDIHALLLQRIAQDTLPRRLNRSEPRVVKRRPKPYQLLTKPRRLMKTIPHRNHYRKSLS